ncbi:MAG: XdhC family protein [Acidimicrobiales bacterium]
MREVLDDIDRWLASGSPVAIARVIGVEGSGPREVGATMAVSGDGQVSGSVSGGCVEGAVVAEATALLAGGASSRTCTFGYSDDDAFAVGLTCGGTLRVLVERLQDGPVYRELSAALRAERPVALATVIEAEAGHVAGGTALGAKLLASVPREGPAGAVGSLGASVPREVPAGTVGSLGDPGLDRVVARDAAGALEAGATLQRHYGPTGQARQREVMVLIESFAAAPRMVIFGAVDFTAALARAAKLLGYRVTVCDARAMFATPERFPAADEVVVDWPDRYLAKVGKELGASDAVCVLTHDTKFDVPAIVAALATRVGYLGAMGSRRTTEQRSSRLLEAGVGRDELRRVMAPIGLDIGARTPEETAVSICAEIIATRTGRPGPSLSEGVGPVHGLGGTRSGGVA